MRSTVRLLPLVLLLALGVARTEAREEPPLRLAAGEGLVLDGRLDEPAWRDATALPVAALEVPAAPGEEPAGATRKLLPEVRALLSSGGLWLGVRLDEPPGVGIGVSGMVAGASTASAADAVAFVYAPQEVRSPCYAVRGPRGVARSVYPFSGAVVLADPATWSLELHLPFPLEDVAGTQAPLLLALAVRTRDPAHLAWVPEAAAWQGPAAWLAVAPPVGQTWPSPVPIADPAALDGQDALDRQRLLAWRDFLAADQWTVDVALEAAGVDPDGEGAYAPALVAQVVSEGLLAPLEQALVLRPDLALLHVVRGHVLAILGRSEDARSAYEAALAIAPGLREARSGLALEVDGPRLADAPVGAPTRYDEALAAAQRAQAEASDPFARDGAAFGRGLLEYLSGAFASAAGRLEPLAARYPFQQTVVQAAERARLGRDGFSLERQIRRLEAEKDDLPRVRLETDAGDVLLELFEDDVPNTVKHFVWLVRHGVYDGTRFSHVVPYLGVFAGPSVDPGYTIPRELSSVPATSPGASARVPRRRSFRGTVAFVSPDASAEGARFLLLTGTALHLDEDQQVFGRVLEGQDALERLEQGARLRAATVVRSRPGTEYRPFTADGEAAPLPPR